MGNSPVLNKLGAVFIHVTDMKRAIAWYSDLLGLPVRSSSHEGTIYDLEMDGGTGVILDSNHKGERSVNQKTQFFFETCDLQASYEWVTGKGIEIVTGIEVHENISFFTFRDPDGNVLMICEDKRKLEKDDPERLVKK